MGSSEVTDNAAESRFELTVDDEIAFAAYVIADDIITFTHTIVPPALEGQGIASKLIGHALGDAKARGLRVVPQCSFVAAYIGRHPEWEAVLA